MEDFNEVRIPARAGIDEWEAALLANETFPASIRKRVSDWVDRMILMHLEATKGTNP